MYPLSQRHICPCVNQLFQNILGKYPYYESNARENGEVRCKNEEKAPLDANKKGKGFGSRNNVRREDFAGTSKALNALQVKFNCGEGNEGGRFLECLRLTMAYRSTKLEGGSDVKTSITNEKYSIRHGRTQSDQTQRPQRPCYRRNTGLEQIGWTSFAST